MRPIPIKMRKILEADPLFQICIHSQFVWHKCDSRITFEHCFRYAGKQIQEYWAIVPCCRSKNNDVTGDDKLFNRFIALYRLFKWGGDYLIKQQFKYPKFDFKQIFALNNKFHFPGQMPLMLKFDEEETYLRNLGVI